MNDRIHRIVINNAKFDFIRTQGVCLRPSDFVLLIMSSVIPCSTVWLIKMLIISSDPRVPFLHKNWHFKVNVILIGVKTF